MSNIYTFFYIRGKMTLKAYKAEVKQIKAELKQCKAEFKENLKKLRQSRDEGVKQAMESLY